MKRMLLKAVPMHLQHPQSMLDNISIPAWNVRGLYQKLFDVQAELKRTRSNLVLLLEIKVKAKKFDTTDERFGQEEPLLPTTTRAPWKNHCHMGY